MAVEKLHPDVGSVIELGGQDAKIIMFKKNEETGDKTAQTSMNDKCASGTGATIDKCVLKVGMPREEVPGLKFDPTQAPPRRREVRRVRRDRHREPREVRHPARRDHELARRRDRLAEPRRADARQHAQEQGPAARRSEHVPAVPAGVLAPAHPRGVGRARLRVRQDRADRGADLRPEELRPLRRVRRGAVRSLRAGERRRVSRPRAARRVHQPRPQVASSASRAGPRPRRAAEPSATRSSRSTRPRLRGRDARSGQDVPRRDRPRRRIDFVEVRVHRREREHPEEGLHALEGQPDPGHEGHVRADEDVGDGSGRDARGAPASASPATPATSSRSRSAPTRTSSRPSRT